MERHVGDVVEQGQGLWSVVVWPGHCRELLACLDPDAPFIVFTCGSPNIGWHVTPVSIHDEPPQPRLVRNLSFELQIDPVEAARVGPLVNASHDGSLDCVQSRVRPVAAADLPEHPAGRAVVMRREGVCWPSTCRTTAKSRLWLHQRQSSWRTSCCASSITCTWARWTAKGRSARGTREGEPLSARGPATAGRCLPVHWTAAAGLAKGSGQVVGESLSKCLPASCVAP